jgi:hypothetical protein
MDAPFKRSNTVQNLRIAALYTERTRQLVVDLRMGIDFFLPYYVPIDHAGMLACAVFSPTDVRDSGLPCGD